MIIKTISIKLIPELCNISITKMVETKIINIPITFNNVLFFKFLSPFTL
jgi:hypothetical protein